MASTPPSRGLLVALIAALGVALLVIAFLLGRESARERVARPVIQAPPPPVEPERPESPGGEPEIRRWPEWADLEDWEEADPRRTDEPAAARVEMRHDESSLLSNRRDPQTPNAASAPRRAPSSAESAVSDYFLQLDVIRSQSGAGDPNAFAMDLIKAAMDGNTAGFDQLIADVERMEEEARRVTPPPSCEPYHQANLDAMAESREVLEKLKAAIARGDIAELTAIAQSAGALQAKAERLQKLRTQLQPTNR